MAFSRVALVDTSFLMYAAKKGRQHTRQDICLAVHVVALDRGAENASSCVGGSDSPAALFYVERAARARDLSKFWVLDVRDGDCDSHLHINAQRTLARTHKKGACDAGCDLPASPSRSRVRLYVIAWLSTDDTS